MREYVAGQIVEESSIGKKLSQLTDDQSWLDKDAKLRISVPRYEYNIHEMCGKEDISDITPRLQVQKFFLNKEIDVSFLEPVRSKEILETFPVDLDIEQVDNLCADFPGYYYQYFF